MILANAWHRLRGTRTLARIVLTYGHRSSPSECRIVMPIAAIAATSGPDTATVVSAPPTASGEPGSSPFQALLGPALAVPPASDALPTLPAAPALAAPGLPVAIPDSEPLVAEQPLAQRAEPVVNGNGLPPAAGLAALLPGLIAAVGGSASAPTASARTPTVGATGAAVDAAGADAPTFGVAGELTPPLQLDTELGSGNTVANAYLQRFMSDPHRVPTAPAADLGTEPLTDALLPEASADVLAQVDGNLAAVPALVTQARAAVVAAPMAASLDAPLPGFGDEPGSAPWQNALDDQLVVMVSKGNQHARIRMHPEELGQLDIRIAVGKDRIDLNFSVQHAAVAQALNQHLPHLAQLFAEQGLAMGQASVSQQQADGGNQAGGGDGRASQPWANAWARQDEELAGAPGGWTPLNRGLFDAFA